MTEFPSYEETTVRPEADQRIDWWQRLVEAEQGFTAGFRANSAFFFYFFTTSILLSFSVVLGLSGVQWALVLLGTCIALSSELLHFCLQKIVQKRSFHCDEEDLQLLSMAKAACMLLLMGAIATIVTILGCRLYELFG